MKNYSSLNAKKKSLGRSMLEVLSVLLVMGLLTVFTLRGLDVAMNRARANKIISDAGDAYATFSITKKQEVTNTWTLVLPAGKSRSGLDFYVQNRNISSKFVTTVRAANVPKNTCVALLDAQSTKSMLIHTAASTLTPIIGASSCKNSMTLYFTFTPEK